MNKMVLDNGILRPRPILGRQNYMPAKKTSSGSLASLKRVAATNEPQICIVRSLGGIGDVLMTTPCIRALRHDWPKAHITYATDFKYMGGALKAVLENNPYIDEVVAYQIALNKDYDYIVDLTPVCVTEEKPKAKVANRIDLFAKHMGLSLKQTGYLPDYFVTQKESEWAKLKLQKYPKKFQDQKRIGIQVRSSTQSRSWPLEQMKELAGLLSKDYQVFLFDSSYGSGDQVEIHLATATTLKDFDLRSTAALINEMDLFVAPDSGLMHIAGALNKRIVAIFAGSDPNARINHYPNAIGIAHTEFQCHPCWYQPKACNSNYNCIKSITALSVYTEANKLMGLPLREPERGVTLAFSDTLYVKRELGGYGDVLCCTCATAKLKKLYPDKKIVMVTPSQYQCVFDNNPDVDHCLTPDVFATIDGWPVYDLTRVDAIREVQLLRATKKIDITRTQMYVDAIGGDATGGDTSKFIPRLYLSQEEKLWAIAKLASDGSKPLRYIAVATESAEQYRNWPIENYQKLFILAGEKHPLWRFVLLSNNRSEIDWPKQNCIDMSGFTFRKAVALLNECNVVLTPDTSMLHVAGALDKPCLAMFGPIDNMARCKFYPKVTTAKISLACVPCWRNANIPCKHENKSHDGFSYCMTLLTPEHILGGLEGLVKNE